MIKQSIINRINRYAKNRELEVTEMNFDKRYWFIV